MASRAAVTADDNGAPVSKKPRTGPSQPVATRNHSNRTRHPPPHVRQYSSKPFIHRGKHPEMACPVTQWTRAGASMQGGDGPPVMMPMVQQAYPFYMPYPVMPRPPLSGYMRPAMMRMPQAQTQSEGCVCSHASQQPVQASCLNKCHYCPLSSTPQTPATPACVCNLQSTRTNESASQLKQLQKSDSIGSTSQGEEKPPPVQTQPEKATKMQEDETREGDTERVRSGVKRSGEMERSRASDDERQCMEKMSVDSHATMLSNVDVQASGDPTGHNAAFNKGSEQVAVLEKAIGDASPLIEPSVDSQIEKSNSATGPTLDSVAKISNDSTTFQVPAKSPDVLASSKSPGAVVSKSGSVTRDVLDDDDDIDPKIAALLSPREGESFGASDVSDSILDSSTEGTTSSKSISTAFRSRRNSKSDLDLRMSIESVDSEVQEHVTGMETEDCQPNDAYMMVSKITDIESDPRKTKHSTEMERNSSEKERTEAATHEETRTSEQNSSQNNIESQSTIVKNSDGDRRSDDAMEAASNMNRFSDSSIDISCRSPADSLFESKNDAVKDATGVVVCASDAGLASVPQEEDVASTHGETSKEESLAPNSDAVKASELGAGESSLVAALHDQSSISSDISHLRIMNHQHQPEPKDGDGSSPPVCVPDESNMASVDAPDNTHTSSTRDHDTPAAETTAGDRDMELESAPVNSNQRERSGELSNEDINTPAADEEVVTDLFEQDDHDSPVVMSDDEGDHRHGNQSSVMVVIDNRGDGRVAGQIAESVVMVVDDNTGCQMVMTNSEGDQVMDRQGDQLQEQLLEEYEAALEQIKEQEERAADEARHVNGQPSSESLQLTTGQSHSLPQYVHEVVQFASQPPDGVGSNHSMAVLSKDSVTFAANSMPLSQALSHNTGGSASAMDQSEASLQEYGLTQPYLQYASTQDYASGGGRQPTVGDVNPTVGYVYEQMDQTGLFPVSGTHSDSMLDYGYVTDHVVGAAHLDGSHSDTIVSGFPNMDAIYGVGDYYPPPNINDFHDYEEALNAKVTAEMRGQMLNNLGKPKSLDDAISKYISYLIQENNVLVYLPHMSNSRTRPVNWNREPYIQEVLQRPATFPTTKFVDFLAHFNIEIEVNVNNGTQTPLKKEKSTTKKVPSQRSQPRDVEAGAAELERPDQQVSPLTSETTAESTAYVGDGCSEEVLQQQQQQNQQQQQQQQQHIITANKINQQTSDEHLDENHQQSSVASSQPQQSAPDRMISAQANVHTSAADQWSSQPPMPQVRGHIPPSQHPQSHHVPLRLPAQPVSQTAQVVHQHPVQPPLQQALQPAQVVNHMPVQLPLHPASQPSQVIQHLPVQLLPQSVSQLAQHSQSTAVQYGGAQPIYMQQVATVQLQQPTAHQLQQQLPPGQMTELQHLPPGQMAELQQLPPGQMTELQHLPPGQMAELQQLPPAQMTEVLQQVGLHSGQESSHQRHAQLQSVTPNIVQYQSNPTYIDWQAETMQAVSQLNQAVSTDMLDSLDLMPLSGEKSATLYDDLMIESAGAQPVTSLSQESEASTHQPEFIEMKPVPIKIVATEIPAVPEPVYKFGSASEILKHQKLMAKLDDQAASYRASPSNIAQRNTPPIQVLPGTIASNQDYCPSMNVPASQKMERPPETQVCEGGKVAAQQIVSTGDRNVSQSQADTYTQCARQNLAKALSGKTAPAETSASSSVQPSSASPMTTASSELADVVDVGSMLYSNPMATAID